MNQQQIRLCHHQNQSMTSSRGYEGNERDSIQQRQYDRDFTERFDEQQRPYRDTQHQQDQLYQSQNQNQRMDDRLERTSGYGSSSSRSRRNEGDIVLTPIERQLLQQEVDTRLIPGHPGPVSNRYKSKVEQQDESERNRMGRGYDQRSTRSSNEDQNYQQRSSSNRGQDFSSSDNLGSMLKQLNNNLEDLSYMVKSITDKVERMK